MSELVPNYLDVTKLALASFLARYREPTLTSYRVDLRCYLRWCAEVDVQPLRVTRAQLEMFLRHLEGSEYAPATVSRRFCTVASFLRYAVIDGLIPTNPADAVTRPKVEWQGQKRTVLHPLEFAALLAAARSAGGCDHAMVALLGMIGLRVSEACHADIDDIRYQSGYEILHVIGKGSKPADIPLPIPVLRAIRDAVGDQSTARSCSTTSAGVSTPAARHAACAGCAPEPALAIRSVRTASGARSARPAWWPVSRSGTCRSRCATATPGRRCATTWPRPTSTGTPPTRLPPTWPA